MKNVSIYIAIIIILNMHNQSFHHQDNNISFFTDIFHGKTDEIYKEKNPGNCREVYRRRHNVSTRISAVTWNEQRESGYLNHGRVLSPKKR